MKNLETRIADWRRTMSTVAGGRNELLDELEGHLREEVDRLIKSGRPADEAFETAVSKLGAARDVGAEFRKFESKPASLPVKLAWIASIAAAILLAFGLMPSLDKRGLLLVSHVFAISLGYGLMFMLGGLGICHVCAQWFDERNPVRRHSLLPAMFQVAQLSAIGTTMGLILGMFWARDNMGRYWGWDAKEVGAVLILGWAILVSALRWLKPGEGTIAFMAIVGNIVTAWGWFGANAHSSGLSSPSFLVAFTASQVLIVLAGVVKGMADSRDAHGAS